MGCLCSKRTKRHSITKRDYEYRINVLKQTPLKIVEQRIYNDRISLTTPSPKHRLCALINGDSDNFF